MAKRSEMSADEWGAKMCRAYDEYAEHHKAGRLDDDAPKAHEILNMLIEGNIAGRSAQAEDEGGLGPVENEKLKVGKDNPPGGNAQPRPPVAGQDSATAADLENAAIRRSGHHDIEGQLALAAARRAAPKSARARRMADAIPGYNRIR